jgi:hypothetical protein
MREEIQPVKKVMQYFAAPIKSLFLVFIQSVTIPLHKRTDDKTK